MDVVDVNLGEEMFISKPMAVMTANLNGPWVIPTLMGADGQTSMLQAMPRHKHRMQALRRFNVSLLGIRKHHIQIPPVRVSKDVVTDKLQKLFPAKWAVLANPSFSERSGVALARCKDLWSVVPSFTPLKGQGRALGVILSDYKGQQWLVFVVHFPNDPAKQRKLWTCLRQERQRFAGTPAVLLGDMNSILHPH